MSSVLDFLAEFSLDTWLLAQAGRGSCDQLVDGRVWERAVGSLLQRPGLIRRQGPGETTLFGFSAASGVPHELDAAADSDSYSVILECKSKAAGVTKADVALFHEKTMDYYCGWPQCVESKHWWRLIVSSSPVSDSVRGFCVQLGVLLCDSVRLSLPVLVRAAGRPIADSFLQETLLQEILRLGEPALLPMQHRWVYDRGKDEFRFKPRLWCDGEIEDLLWVQDEISSDLLDLYDLYRPGVLERRASVLRGLLTKVA